MAGRQHQRYVVARFGRQARRDAPEIFIFAALAAGFLAHDASNPVLTGVVRRCGEIPATETIVQLRQIVERCAGRLDRVATFVDVAVYFESVALTSLGNELPQPDGRGM